MIPIIVLFFIIIFIFILYTYLKKNRRKDDNPQTIKKRINTYKKNSDKIQNYYKNILINVSTKEHINTVFNNVRKVIIENGLPRKIILLGSPGSGKTTIAQLLSKELNITSISLGHILRSDNTLDPEIKKQVENGILIEPKIIKNILNQYFTKEVRKNGWILDGCPRNTEDVFVLEELNIFPQIVIHLALPDEKIQKRIQKNIREDLTSFNEVTNEKLVNCEGCIDEMARCRQGTVAQCKNVGTNLCYAFYDENGNQRTPCGVFDRSKDAELSCTGCQKYCQWCIDKNGDGTCIGREIFNCDLCPNSRICKENPFDIYIKKGD